MKIGNFKFDERINDILGKIATREMHFPYLVMRKVTDRQSDATPLYEIFETNRAGDEIQIGAVWERKMNRSGDTFLSGMIDDPSFPEPLSIALFGDERNGFNVAARPRPGRAKRRPWRTVWRRSASRSRRWQSWQPAGWRLCGRQHCRGRRRIYRRRAQ
jgi:uncharacterized protein (DUF736 family)